MPYIYWIIYDYDITTKFAIQISPLLNLIFTNVNMSTLTNLSPHHGPHQVPTWEEEPNWQSPQLIWIQPPKSELALKLQIRAAPSVEAHHSVSGPNTGRISKGCRSAAAEQSKASVFSFRLRSWMRRPRVRISAKAIYEFINFSN